MNSPAIDQSDWLVQTVMAQGSKNELAFWQCHQTLDIFSSEGVGLYVRLESHRGLINLLTLGRGHAISNCPGEMAKMLVVCEV